MTAQEILVRAQASRPDLRFAINRRQIALGVWSAELGRYVAVAMKEIVHGRWVSLEHEALINGKPPVDDWIEA